MSKRLGNAVDPFETITKYGADATRWYMISNANPWDNLKFDEDGIVEARRRFFGTLYNTYGFFALYANIDQYDPATAPQVAYTELPEIDRWIISRLNSLTKEVTALYSAYDATPACRAIDSFVNDELSNWYVRQCRRRFWRGDMTQDKRAAYQTLYSCLLQVAHLMSPVAPFYADHLYRDLTRVGAAAGTKEGKGAMPDSVHLSLLIPANESLIDEDLERRMDYAQRISSLTLSLRKSENLRVRQPLQKILVPALDAEFQRRVAAVSDIIRNEVNIKEVEFLTDDDFLKKSIKADFRILGKRLGKQMKDAAARINQMTAEEIATLEKSGAFFFTLGDEEVAITAEDVVITTEDIPGWKVATDGELTVALDVTISPELAQEGLARELVNRIQNLRKDEGLEVTDRIRIRMKGSSAVGEAAGAFRTYLMEEVLADSLVTDPTLEGEVLELPGGETLVLSLVRA
jgi:isoleucyl-tRNA synthetase